MKLEGESRKTGLAREWWGLGDARGGWKLTGLGGKPSDPTHLPPVLREDEHRAENEHPDPEVTPLCLGLPTQTGSAWECSSAPMKAEPQ